MAPNGSRSDGPAGREELNRLLSVALSRREFLGVAGGLSGAAILAACGIGTSGSPSPSTLVPRAGGILRVAYPDAPVTLDPQAAQGRADLYMGEAIFDSLTSLTNSNQLLANLATSWQAENGGRSWVFKLRSGVTFHDGSPFTANDVVATFKRALDPKLALPAKGTLGPLAGVELIDDHSVKFTLSTPYADLPTQLASPNARILSAAAIARGDLKTKPVGTGPFKFVSTQVGVGTKLAKNETYWMSGRPYLDGIQSTTLLDNVAQQAALASGAIDVVLELDVQNFVQLGGTRDVNVYATPAPNQYVGVFTPHNMPPFDDVKVRQAFKWLLNRQALVDSLQFGKAVVANDQPLAPGNRWNFNQSSLTQYKQDLPKAKSLLQQAGKSSLSLDLFSWTARPPGPDIAVAMQAAADNIGVTINVKPVDTATYFGDVIFKKSLYTSGRASRMPTLWDTIYAIYHSKSPVNYGVIEVAPGLDDLLEKMLAELDVSKQQTMVAQAMALIHDNGFWIMPMFMNNFAAASSKVGGLQAPVSDATMDFRSVFLTA